MTDDEEGTAGDADADDDPFADFEHTDDGGDPFADLRDDADERPGDGDEDPDPFDAGSGPGRLPDDPFSRDRPPGIEAPEEGSDGDAGTDDGFEFGGRGTGDETDEPGVPDAGEDTADDADDPFASLGGGAHSRTGAGDADDDPFAAFESVEVDGLDPDEVWAGLESLEDGEMPGPDERVYYEVSKHRFCERCEYFTGPPDVECTFDGAKIVEFVDMETVRLVNCPVVAEQEELGEDVTRYEAE